MANRILNTILSRKIENFVSTFVVDSDSIFYKKNQLFHPGEYGKYRENSLSDLIRTLISPRYKISDGFIITSNDKISTQCDIVIYDNTDLPILENNYSQFFTVESILSIGEVKSTLTKSKFKDALIKLAHNKQLSENIGSWSIKETKKKGNEYNHPISFLVCKNTDFDTSKIDFEDIYNGIERKYWHNLILCIENGIFTYTFKFDKLKQPYRKRFLAGRGDIKSIIYTEHAIRTAGRFEYDCEHEFIKLKNDKKHEHISIFLNMLVKAIDYKTLFSSDLISYADVPKANIFKNK